jgi:hypothetical protein
VTTGIDKFHGADIMVVRAVMVEVHIMSVLQKCFQCVDLSQLERLVAEIHVLSRRSEIPLNPPFSKGENALRSLAEED